MLLSPARMMSAGVLLLLVSMDIKPANAQVQDPPGPGSPKTIFNEIDANDDGVVDRTTKQTITYDDGRAVLIVVETDNNADGTIDRLETRVLTYDADGRLDEENADIDINPVTLPGVDQTRLVTFTYDSRGNVLESVNTITQLSTATVTAVLTTTSTWDSKDNLLTQISDNDNFPLGQSANDNTAYRTLVYDNHGNVIESNFEIDDDSDGDIDVRSETTLERDNNGRVISQQTLTDSPTADATVPDAINPNEIVTFFGFEFQGKKIVQLFSTRADGPLPGSNVITNLQTFAYDQKGNQIERNVTYDLNGNETFGDIGDNTLTSTNGYDKKGNLLVTYSEIDVDGDGFRDQVTQTTFTY